MTQKTENAGHQSDANQKDVAGNIVLHLQNLQTFEFESVGNVRAICENGEAWFCAKDVCTVLGLEPRDSCRHIDDDEIRNVRIFHSAGQKSPIQNSSSNMLFLSECGIYALVFHSRKPEAKAFTRWVTHEVLPQIRKTGAYSQQPQPGIDADLIAQRLDAIERRLAARTPRARKSLPQVHEEELLYTVNETLDRLNREEGVSYRSHQTAVRQIYRELIERGYAYKDKFGYHPTAWAEENGFAGEIVKSEIRYGTKVTRTTTVGLTSDGYFRYKADLFARFADARREEQAKLTEV